MSIMPYERVLAPYAHPEWCDPILCERGEHRGVPSLWRAHADAVKVSTSRARLDDAEIGPDEIRLALRSTDASPSAAAAVVHLDADEAMRLARELIALAQTSTPLVLAA